MMVRSISYIEVVDMLIEDGSDVSREIYRNDRKEVDPLSVETGDEFSVSEDDFLDEILSGMAWNG